MEDITELFISIIKDCDSIDIAEAEFRRHLVDNPDLRKAYKEYCHEVGSSERKGFQDFCEQYMEEQDEVWNTLSDFDNQE